MKLARSTAYTTHVVLSQRNLLALVGAAVRGREARLVKVLNDGRELSVSVESDETHYDRLTGRA